MNKKFLTFLMLAAGAAMGCTEEMIDPSELGEKTIWAVMDEGNVQTRTCVSDDEGEYFGVLWCKGDAIGVYSASGTENAKFDAQIEEPAGKAAFKGNFAGTPAYAYYPYNEQNANSSTITGNLPLEQEFSTADGLLKYDYKLGVPSAKNADEFTFNHLFSLFRFTVNADGTGVEGQKLKKVEITFPDGVTLSGGEFTVPVKGGDIKWSSTSTGKTLTLNWTDAPAMTKGQTLTGYLNCPPVKGLQGKTITVTLTTTNHVVSFNATVNVDSFEAAYVYTFPLTLSKWANKDGSSYEEKEIEIPSIYSIKFTAAGNPGKISGTKVFYDTSIKKTAGTFLNKKTYTGFTSYTTDASATTQTMTVNEAEGTITGYIPYLNNRLLVPEVSMSEGAVLMYDNGGGFIEWDGKAEIDFSAGKIIRVSNNGVNRDYVVQITNTGLPVVVINQPGGDTNWDQTGLKLWAKATEFDDLENNNPGSITIYNADGTVNLETAVSMTRLRGNTSQDYPKKPFAIKLGRKAGLLGMAKHKRWVLLANWKDKSLIRNHIAFGIARTFTENLDGSIPWNVHGQFVELVYNGVHVGNYYLCEQIKIDENRLNISAPYEKDGAFTKWTDYGYLLESDDYYDEPSKFATKHYIPFMFKDDVDANGEILSSVKNMILDIEDKIYKGYTSTSANDASAYYEEAYKMFDLNSMVDQLLIYEMTMNAEFRHPKSLYTYIDHTEGSPKYGKLCAGPVWDFDFETFPTLGDGFDFVEAADRKYEKSIMATSSLSPKRTIGTSVPTITGVQPDALKNDAPYMWYPLLIKNSKFTETAVTRWQSIKGKLWEYASEIERMRIYLATSWECNNSMWPACYSEQCDRQYQTSSGFCGDEYLGTFDQVMDAFYAAYTERYNGMDDFVVKKIWLE